MVKIFAVILISLVLASCEERFPSMPQMRVDKMHRMELAGVDFIVFEFTPSTALHMQCVFVAGPKPSGLECFPKVQP